MPPKSKGQPGQSPAVCRPLNHVTEDYASFGRHTSVVRSPVAEPVHVPYPCPFDWGRRVPPSTPPSAPMGGCLHHTPAPEMYHVQSRVRQGDDLRFISVYSNRQFSGGL